MKNIKIAMVGAYGTNCGMATYSRYLIDEMRPYGTIKVFAEYTDEKVGDTADVVRCWDRSTGVYHNIIGEVKKFAPDIVYVQHEYGSFGNPAGWNTLIGHLSHLYRTVVVLHSVYDHPDKLIFEAPCQEIIVHSESARELLKRRKVDHCRIHLIPHGCMKAITLPVPYSTAKAKKIIFQYGFGFEYKGWNNVPEIISGLKDNFPDVTYIGIFNMSKFYLSFHEKYYSQLMNNFVDSRLDGNIVLHKGFRSEEIILSYMKQARVNLFPYWNHPDWLVHGASGAVRLALASGTPTIVGDVPFFSEFKGYIPVCKNVKEYIVEIEKIFRDKAYADQVRAKTLTFINERSWDRIARWYLSITQEKDFTAPVTEFPK